MPAEAHKIVRIYPIGTVEVRVSLPIDCTDLDFHEACAPIWNREPTGQIFINEQTSLAELRPFLDERLGELVAPAADYLGTQLDGPAPFSARLPYALHAPVRDALTQVGRAHVVAWEPPAPSEPLVLLDLWNGNYVLAHDFEVDMPTFAFDDAWCRVDGR